MAFGIDRAELQHWKLQVRAGEIAFLTHFWLDPRFPDCNTVTKVGCLNKEKLIKWGEQYGLMASWLDERGKIPHFDLFGKQQLKILKAEGQWKQIKRFKLDS